jgi:manganese/zinc/iron transport system substrate-binding protein
MRSLILILLLIVLAFANIQAQDDTFNIVTTTTQVTDLVTVLAGDLVGSTVEITPLMGAGVDPHLYRPTESDIAAMNEADLVVYSGLHLEGQFDQVFEALGEQNIRTYAISEPVENAGYTIGGFDLSAELQNVDDPHFWFDPRNWQLAADGLTSVLVELDPANSQVYQANYEQYYEELDLLYVWALEAMSLVPQSQRVLVTSHDAFQYFGAAFGWEVRGLQGISTESEAGVADIQAIADFVTDNAIPVMFVESSVPPDAIEAVQEAVEAAGGTVRLGVRTLYSDAMGEADSFGGTYMGMIAENVITILQSFEIPVPELPEALELDVPEELIEG